jgi:hypothetical protein
METIQGARFVSRRSARWWHRALLVAALAGVSTASPQSSQDLRYGGPSTWTSTGPVGGPFSSSGFTATLGNRSNQPLRWSATSVPSYLNLSAQSGVLQPHTRTHVQVTLDQAVAQSMAAGDHTSPLIFHNSTSTETDINVTCTLSVQIPASQLVPATDFYSQGAAGGPFTPDSQSYALTNMGNGILDWQARAADNWVSISPSSGQLAPGASVSVVVSIEDPATGSLSIGVHRSVVEWREVSSSAVLHTRNVNLNIQQGSSSTGWTVFTPSADTRIVYVSSSTGNDSNNGLSDTSPKQSIAAGKSLLRNGFPDWLLLKCGDAWDERLDTNGQFGLNGRSLTERMLVSSYGTGARPLLRTGTSDALDNFSAGQGNHVAVVGLHFWANLYNGSQGTPKGVQWMNETANFLLEDCYVEGYETNLVIMGANEYPASSGRHTNVSIRRNVIVDAYNTANSNSEGVYASGIDGLLIEENVLDHNGWRDDVPGSGPTWYRRNIYIQNLNTGVVVRGNIIASTDGLQQRSGGICENNLFLRNAINLAFGGGGFPDIEPNGVSGSVRNNVILDGGDLQPGQARGWGMNIAGNITQSTIQGNIIAHNVNGHAPIQAVFSPANNGRGVENTVFSGNVIYAWGGSTVFQTSGPQTLNFQLHDNKFQNEVTADTLIVHDQAASAGAMTSANNVFDAIAATGAWMQAGPYLSLAQWKPLVHDTTSIAQQFAFPDPSRTIATYHASIGGAPTLVAFMAGARLQSKSNWRLPYTADAVNTYIRAGFGM